MVEVLGAAFYFLGSENGFYSKNNCLKAPYKPLSVLALLSRSLSLLLYLVLPLVCAHAPSSRYNTADSHKH